MQYKGGTVDKDDLAVISKTAQSILKNEIKHLPLIPSVALKLLELTQDDKAKLIDLTHLIETDPALTAKLLQHVNSATYRFSHKISDIKQAVQLLGFSDVRQLALDLLFYDKLIKNQKTKLFDGLFFWQHCLFVALLSKKIAIALNHPHPDQVYTAGLIHDIGKVVLEVYGRMTYSDFIPTLKNSENTITENERRFFGMTHTEIGHVFCAAWHLPEPITAVVACHHELPAVDSLFAVFKTEIAIVAFANYVAWMQGISSVVNEANPILPAEVLETLQFAQLDLDDLLQQVDQDMQNTREFYGIQFPAVTKLRAALVKTTINLSQLHHQETPTPTISTKNYSGLTAPHHSLNPNEFVPMTLAAIGTEFCFDRCLMLAIDPKQRCLLSTYRWPECAQTFDIELSHAPEPLLQALREKKAQLINGDFAPNKPLLYQLNVAEFFIVPVLNHNRLVGVLYADNGESKKPLNVDSLAEMLPIANELGIALFNAKQYDQQKKCAQLDPLTQLYNKRMVDEFLSKAFNQPKNSLAQTAVGFIDIDKFKLFNDLCGHQAGDDVLKIVADILRGMTRPGDFIGRYGGEEFLFVLKNTDKAGAYSFAERIRVAIEQRGKLMSQRFHDHALTVSIGVALYHPHYSTYMELINVADQAMYRAKNSGRNKVVMLLESSK
ncbi:MAG: HDOD domain-containing protein [Methylovulum sp.]|nr:HDOD domain-containing protein [Methylovulum sp.]MCF7999637.1 HDOD domain-containing protein [Methylovulum sp.]